MAFPDRQTSNVLLTILHFSLVLTILYAARRVLLIFAFAILFAYLIDPVVRFLQRRSLFFKNLRGPHAGTDLRFQGPTGVQNSVNLSVFRGPQCFKGNQINGTQRLTSHNPKVVSSNLTPATIS
jgi:hypothetical protein